MTAEVLVARDLSKRLSDGSSILDSVSLGVASGELVSVIGPSGAGKSTLLSLIGLLDSPTSGTITLRGERIENLPKRRASFIRRQHLGFLFQNVHLMLGLSALENTVMGLAYSGVSTEERAERARAALERVGMSNYEKRAAVGLSGGERQRVALARAMVHEPDVLLCDEPTGSLDPANGDRIIELLQAEADRGTSVVVVTHSPELASHSTRVIELAAGGVVRAS